jgi:SAM-dependent methyltransferase
MFRHIVKKWIGANKKNTEQVAGEHATHTASVYKTSDDALKATDEFYKSHEGFQYSEHKVTEWIRKHVKLPKKGRVLDLCCGDGIWSKGIQNINPKLELYGIDISQGAIAKACKLLNADDKHFIAGDAEVGLPFEDGFYHLIFARGPGLYNQHDMDRPATIRVIESWHLKLAPSGFFYSIFASTPEKMGTYTPMDEAKLPYNRSPRLTETVDFRGGKYHHTIQSFLTPFWKAENVVIVNYSFLGNQHVLITRLAG